MHEDDEDKENQSSGFLTPLLNDTREQLSLMGEAAKQIGGDVGEASQQVYQDAQKTLSDSGTRLLRSTRSAMSAQAICANLTSPS